MVVILYCKNHYLPFVRKKFQRILELSPFKF